MKHLFYILIGIILLSCAQNKITENNKGYNRSGTLLKTSDGDVFEMMRDEDITSSNSSYCPDNMVEVKGMYCPKVEEICLKWLDKDQSPSANQGEGPLRCAEFKYPTKCLSKEKKYMHFCMDRFSYPNVEGDLPKTQMSWVEAKNSCEQEGKRLCQDYEFTFACEGEEMKPYPYGDGYHRDSAACNIDKPWINPWTHSFAEVDQRVPSGQYKNCISPFGVRDMVGNVDQWVVNSSGRPYVSGLKGGHAVGARNRCIPETTAHNSTFTFYETGARCCSDGNH